MFFSKPASSPRRRSTQSQLGSSISNTAKYRSNKMAGRRGRPHPARPLPYYEDYHGVADPDEDRRADFCESETDEDVEIESSKKKKRNTDEDSGQYRRSEFDYRPYGRPGLVDWIDEEEGETLFRGRTNESLRSIGARYQQAITFDRSPGHSSAAPLSKLDVENRAGQDICSKHSTAFESEDSPQSLRLFYHKAASNEGQNSARAACPTCGTVVENIEEHPTSKEVDFLQTTSEHRLLDSADMYLRPTRQAPKLESVRNATESMHIKNSQVATVMIDLGDGLRDINQDYRLLEPSTTMTEQNKEVPAAKKVNNNQKQKAKKEGLANSEREGIVAGQARQFNRGAELVAQREQEEQRLAHRRVTRRIAAKASSTPAHQLKSKKYGRGGMTARSAVLSSMKSSRRKNARALPLLKADGGKRSLCNWKGEALKLEPGQLIPVVSMEEAHQSK